MTILMCVSYFLIIPFVRLYTDGVSDIQYIYPTLPVMFCLVQIISWSRYVTGNLTAIAGYAKNTGRVSLVEALLNVMLSVILVGKFGIVGVLFATVIALPLKVIYCTYLSYVKILKRTPLKTLKILVPNYILFALCVVSCNYINIVINNFVDFIIYGIILTLIIGFVGVTVNVLANKECKNIITIVKKERRERI